MQMLRTMARLASFVVASCVFVLFLAPVSFAQRVPQAQGGNPGPPGGSGSDSPNADPPCFSNFNRFVPCGNGTVTGGVTRLVWLQDAACLGFHDWASANQAAALLEDGMCGLNDGSHPGDWRLPSEGEFLLIVVDALARGCVGLSGPSWTNDAGTGCLTSGGGTSFLGLNTDSYWTGSSNGPLSAISISLLDGGRVNEPKTVLTNRAWGVKGGTKLDQVAEEN